MRSRIPALLALAACLPVRPSAAPAPSEGSSPMEEAAQAGSYEAAEDTARGPEGPPSKEVTPAVPATTLPAESQQESLARGRFFKPEPGFLRPEDLPEGFRAKVDTLVIEVMDAFEGADAHTKAERWAFEVGNKLHIESRPGTIRRRILFNPGDTISRDVLVESERVLRSEAFLADAIFEVGPERNGARAVKVTVYDQWTTVVAPILSSPDFHASDLWPTNWDRLSDNEWIYGLGIWESNFLGTGTRLGGAYIHDLQRETMEFGLSNKSITRYDVQGSLYAAWLSDGHSYHAKLTKPLESREDRYGFITNFSSLQLTEFYYFNSNQLDDLPDQMADSLAGEDHIQREYRGVATDSVLLAFTRSYGTRTKVSVGPTFLWLDRYQKEASVDEAPAISAALPPPQSALEPELRTDALLGAAFSVYQYEIKTARNFHNLKWNESVRTGWRLNFRGALNQKWLRADNGFLWLNGEAIAGQAWKEAFFASCSLSAQSFIMPSGDYLDGRVDASLETQWKPMTITSTVIAASWSNYFATPQSRQLLLGASEGLAGYPSFYYSGQARFLATAEQRYFPEFELLTQVAAFTGFLVAGNTFNSWSDFDPGDLHYSVGAGLRLGRSKSTTKTVQHINISFPVGDEFLKGPSLSVVVRKNL